MSSAVRLLPRVVWVTSISRGAPVTVISTACVPTGNVNANVTAWPITSRIPVRVWV